MASRGSQLKVTISGDASHFRRTIKETEAEAGHFAESTKRSFEKVHEAGKLLAEIGGISALAFGLKDVTEEAVKAEAEQHKLKNTVKDAGLSWKQHGKQIDEWLDKTSAASGFAKSELAASFGNFIRTTGNVSKAQKLANEAMDVARSRGVGLASAQSMLARVYNGSYTGLKRLGIAITPVTTAQDALKEGSKKATVEQTRHAKALDATATRTEALGLVQKKFGGQAQAYASSTAGAFDRAKASLQLAEETVGKAVLPMMAKAAQAIAGVAMSAQRNWPRIKASITAAVGPIIKDISSMVGWFNRHKTATTVLISVTAGLAAGFVAYRTAVTIAAGATKIAAAATAVLNAVMDANPIGLVVLALAALAGGLVVAYKRSATFRSVVHDAFHAVHEAWQNWIKPTIDGIIQSFKGLIGFVTGVFTGDWHKAWAGIKNIASGMASGIGHVIVRGIIGALGQLGHMLLGKIKDSIGFAAKALTDPGGAIAGIGKSIGNAIAGGIGDGPGRAIVGASMGTPGLGGGMLMGADADLAPFAALAHADGLVTTSGLRPGAHTLTGGLSYHATGDAIDESGSMGGMFRYASQMFHTYGGRLRELISPFPQFGIKDGRPYRYSGAIEAQHSGSNAHVHVAYTGPFGDGPGRGRGPKGDGYGLVRLAELWKLAGGSSTAAGLMAHVALAESGGNPRAHNPSGASGLWQILGKPFKGNVYDPLTNARMAVWKFKHQGLGAWAASRHEWAKYLGADDPSSKTALRGGRGSSGRTGPNLSGGGSVTGFGNTAAGVGSTRPGGPNEALIGPGQAAAQGGYDQRLATASGHEAAARSRDSVKGLIKALKEELAIKLRRLRHVRRLLRRHLRKATRLALTQEQATLIGDIADLRASLKEYRADEAGGATTITRADQLDAGVDPNAPTQLDYLNAATAQAALTPGAADDIAAARNLVNYEQGVYNAAVASGDPVKIAQAAGDLKNAIDALATLTQAVDAQTDVQKQLLDATQQLANAQTAILNLAQTQGPQMLAGLAAMLSGSIGGKVGLAFQTPGYAGSTVRY